MRCILSGNLLNLHEGTDSNGNNYYSASILSGDDVVRIKFDESTKFDFDSLKSLERMDICAVSCDMKLYKGNLYFNAVND